MLHLQQILDFIPNASTEELKKILNAIQNELPKREGNVDNYIEHIENFGELKNDLNKSFYNTIIKPILSLAGEEKTNPVLYWSQLAHQ